MNWVVNTDVCADLGIDVPAQWDDLLQPELKGWVSMPNPASSGTAYNTVSAILQTRGEDTGWEYLTKLIDQVPFFTDRGSDPQNNVIAGEAAVGINAGTGNVALTEDYKNIKVVYPTDGTGWWPQPAAILDGCSNEEAAKVFIDWLLSERGLAEVAEAQNAAVVKQDVVVPDGILSLDSINLFATDFKSNATQREAILNEWSTLVTAAGK
ncbi:MAG: extracellular solute-binding protein [Clostridiaceae bacterium]|nr:extracellular solute-binding protein [Clostridiaceae bacterium]